MAVGIVEQVAKRINERPVFLSRFDITAVAHGSEESTSGINPIAVVARAATRCIDLRRDIGNRFTLLVQAAEIRYRETTEPGGNSP